MSEKLLSIKEFEYITDNVEYSDGDTGNIHYLPSEKFRALDDFARKLNGKEEGSDALDFFKAYTKRGIGNVIQAKNYVGLIQLDSGFQVQILPKIDLIDMEAEDPTPRIFLKMLKSMKDFPGKVFSMANLRVESTNLYEIFINMYVTQVSELTKRGLKSTYLRTEDNLNKFKGKLLVGEHIKKNAAHKERFYVAFDEYSQNRPENRIIKATLLKLQKISKSSANVKAIRQQLVYFEMTEASANYSKDFSRIHIDRTTKDYEDVIEWSRVFLLNKGFSTFSGNTKARALLFPMEKIYEAYVARQMQFVFGEKGFDVSVQDKGHYLFKEGHRDVFSLRPDIVITDAQDHKIIMDTKWKRLKDDPGENYGVSQADMYQMYAYSKKYKTRDIWLLYPVVEGLMSHGPITYKDQDSDEAETTVSLFFIDLADIENCLKELLKRVQEQIIR